MKSVFGVIFVFVLASSVYADDLDAMVAFVASFNSSCVDPSWSRSTPVCSWAGVVCTADRVTTFGFSSSCTGFLHLHLLPPKLQNLTLDYNMFTGPITLTSLPPGLEVLSIQLNALTGSLNLTALPSTLVTLELADNQFEGGVVFSRLPPDLQKLDLGGNQLSGPMDLSHLPKSLTALNLPGNNFCGSGSHNLPCADLWLPGPCSCVDSPTSTYTCPPCS